MSLDKSVNDSAIVRLKGSTFNEFASTLRRLDRQPNIANDRLPRGQQRVLVKNVSGVNFREYRLIKLGAPLPTPYVNAQIDLAYQQQHVFEADLPANPFSVRERWAITQERIPDGHIGEAIVSGISTLAVNLNNVNDLYVRPNGSSGNQFSVSTIIPTGVELLTPMVTGESEQFPKVLIGRRFHGAFLVDILAPIGAAGSAGAAPSSGSADVMRFNGTNIVTNGEASITVYNMAGAIAAGIAQCKFIQGYPFVDVVIC